MTFADFAQNPLGTLGHFDPVTGVGSVTVPDIDPGSTRSPQPASALARCEPARGRHPKERRVPRVDRHAADIDSPEFQDFINNYPAQTGTSSRSSI